MSVTLTTIGSQTVEFDAQPAALPEAIGGMTLWVRYAVGTPVEERTAYTFTAAEAKQLVADVGGVMGAER